MPHSNVYDTNEVRKNRYNLEQRPATRGKETQYRPGDGYMGLGKEVLRKAGRYCEILRT